MVWPAVDSLRRHRNSCLSLTICVAVLNSGLVVEVNSSSVSLVVISTNTSGIIRSRQRWYYSDNMNCQWNLTSNVKLELVFLHFKTASPADYVNVYDGGSPLSPLIATFSGSSLPAPIISSSNNLYVTFTTNATGRNEGLIATYRGRKHPNL